MQKYFTLIFALLFSISALAADEKEGASKTYEGTLTTGVMAIGGETTGTTLKTKDGALYELDFGKHADLAKLSDELNGKQVVVSGAMHVVQGVETGERHIIEVTGLKKSER